MFDRATLAEVRKASMRARAQLRERRGGAARELSPGVAALEASATAFAFGCAQGRSGGDGMADLWIGATLHALSLLTGDESWFATNARALGTGALVACAYRHGFAAGERAVVTAAGSSERSASATIDRGSSVTMELTVARLTVTARR